MSDATDNRFYRTSEAAPPFSMHDFVAESNMIERIYRAPTLQEIDATIRFVDRGRAPIAVQELIELVAVYAPGMLIRDKAGMDVRVGRHLPQEGGPMLVAMLETLLKNVNAGLYSAFQAHCVYEDLHPFMDGNGRSGRALWLRMMGGIDRVPLGFLHTFYYQTLQTMR